MRVLYHIIVHSLLLVATPYIFGRCIFDESYRRDILLRLSPIKKIPKDHGGIWIHASSAGEVRAASLLWRALIEVGFCPILSTFTTSGHELAKKEGIKPAFRLPPDSPLWIAPLLKKLKPSALILIEAELWPSLLWQCEKRSIPVILINGRMSTKSFNRYSKFNRFFLSVASAITLFSMRNQQDAERIRRLGISPNKIHATGNLKFDTVFSDYPNAIKQKNSETPMIVFGSTRPGDEGPILDAIKKLLAEFPNLRCVLAPRHIQRTQEIERLIKNFELDYIKQSEILGKNHSFNSHTIDQVKQDKNKLDVILVDTMGDLNSYYKQSDLAFVGGGFDPRFGGHNILEPAVWSQPVIYGNHMSNFLEEVRLLNESKGGIQIDKPEQLYPTLRRLVGQPKEREKLGKFALEAVLANQGSVQKNIKLIESLLH